MRVRWATAASSGPDLLRRCAFGTNRRRHHRVAIPGFALVALLTACGDDPTGPAPPGMPPETAVVATPPELDGTSTNVAFSWTGSDPDGEVRAFQWRISDNGPDGMIDTADTLAAGLPWRSTTAVDSVFRVSADVPGDGGRAWQTHTFFVRAVDTEGYVDPTPAHVSFTATTLSPTVRITSPRFHDEVGCVDRIGTLPVAWEATDPDPSGDEPILIRTLLRRIGGAEDPCLTRAEYESGAQAITGDDPAWSAWFEYVPAEFQGDRLRLPDRVESGSAWLVAVQARDPAGAVSPDFQWGRNVRHFRVVEAEGPELVMSDRFLGTHTFPGPDREYAAATMQTVEFEWRAQALGPGNTIDALRYGFDVVELDDEDDPGWVQGWRPSAPAGRIEPRVLRDGSPNIVLQVRDLAGNVTTAMWRFAVTPAPRRSEQRPLLLVDDVPQTIGVESSELYDRIWDRRWRILIDRAGVTDFRTTDVLDVSTRMTEVNLLRLSDYRGVIWFVGPGNNWLSQRVAPRTTDTPRYNWLQTYQAFIGNLMIVGAGAMTSTIESGHVRYPLVLDGSGGATLGGVDEAGEWLPNAGVRRYPYTGWCVEVFDRIEPLETILDPEVNRRSTRCWAVVYAGPTRIFHDEFGTGPTQIGALRPTDLRLYGSEKYHSGPGGLDPAELGLLSLKDEETYNATFTVAPVQVTPRECQVPMYLSIARRDVDQPLVFDPPEGADWPSLGLQPGSEITEICASRELEISPSSLKPIAIASRAFSGYAGRPATKQEGRLRAADFLWGFNPLHFDEDDVSAALRWILIDHWGVSGP